jgi:hypothetical protein
MMLAEYESSELDYSVSFLWKHIGATDMLFLSSGYQSGVPGSGEDNGAAVMRGPLAVKVVAQL